MAEEIVLPARAYHGTTNIDFFSNGMPPANGSHWFKRASWREHDRWMAGGPHLETGIPYANIIWEAIGLRYRNQSPAQVAEWARQIKSYDELSSDYGIIFVTDAFDAARKYGDVYEIELSDPSIVDIIADPHVRTHNGWILIIRSGSRLPLKSSNKVCSQSGEV